MAYRRRRRRKSAVSIKRAALKVFGRIRYYTTRAKANASKRALGIRDRVRSIKPRRIKNRI